MAQLTNSPEEVTILRLKARKSFALGIFIADSNGHPLDITGAILRLVVRKPQIPLSVVDDSGNLIITSHASIEEPLSGYGVFRLQAAELEDPPGEYAYSITLIHQGYSSVIVEGPLELEQNTEFTSVDETYATVGPPQALKVLMREQKAIRVYAGYVLPPGTQHFTDGDKIKLDGIEPGAEVNVNADWAATSGDAYILNKPTVLLPPGGVPPEVLTKRTDAPGDAIWSMPQTGGDLIIEEDPTDPLLGIAVDDDDLDSVGVPPGYSPVSDGNGSWFWAPVVGTVTSVNGETGQVVLDLDDILDTAGRLAMTPEERQIIANLSSTVLPVASIPNLYSSPGVVLLGTSVADPEVMATGEAQLLVGSATANLFWLRKGPNAPGATKFSIDENGKITLGSADAALIVTGVLNAARLPRIGSILGNTSGTAVPTGGSDGDEYFQYT
jgi:hypothetical protein